MVGYLAQGFMLGLAYVAPIGMQNLYVINTAISKDRIRAYQVALITSFFDISLALACFFGMGMLMEKSQMLRGAILLIGSLVVIYIGVGLIRSKVETDNNVDVNKSLIQVVIACFTVTWMNPQALIDGSLLLGGFRASLPIEGSRMFILGVCLASLSWFTGVTTIVSIFRNNFNNKIIQTINIVCGGVIIYYGLKLLYTFIQMVR
ncbi:LysE/ArgO family amino acid transporter [Crassaminicella profunda]|uniref:LysE/ArgO family amino acid transporter n=1 Tax=Crassaminicella profunda TaxID=1286698 RepID=UPI001CA621E1|nr:LysE family transporter [Crassaminicella profunda]QZY55183.1 LysE family transporter [Crassaminicella profunda]